MKLIIYWHTHIDKDWIELPKSTNQQINKSTNQQINMDDKKEYDRNVMRIRKSMEKNVNKNAKGHNLNLKHRGFSADEILRRINNYKYLKTNQKICGVKKTRPNNLLCKGCPGGKKCRGCSDNKSYNGKKKEDRNVCRDIIKNIDEYVFDAREPEIIVSEYEDLKFKKICLGDFIYNL